MTKAQLETANQLDTDMAHLELTISQLEDSISSLGPCDGDSRKNELHVISVTCTSDRGNRYTNSFGGDDFKRAPLIRPVMEQFMNDLLDAYKVELESKRNAFIKFLNHKKV